MHFDAALNCAWLFLGIIAIASTLGAARRSHAGRSSGSGRLQLVGVALVVLALFPYISATDDVLRIANALPQDKQSESSPRSPGSDLVRLYETADAPLIGQICTISVTFAFFWFVTIPTWTAIRRSIPQRSGRSPPLEQAFA